MKKIIYVITIFAVSFLFIFGLSSCDISSSNKDDNNTTNSTTKQDIPIESNVLDTSSTNANTNLDIDDNVYFTITFKDYNGVILQTSNVKKGDTPTYNKSNPKRENDDNFSYTFSDWTPTISKASEDIVYTATYSSKALPYNVTINLNGGTSSITKLNFKTDKITINMLPFDVVKKGYAFKGYELNGIKVYDENGNVVNNYKLSSNMTFKAVFEEAVTLTIYYSIYDPKTNKLINTYNTKPDLGTVSETKSYNYNTYVDLFANPKEGYTFVGWYINNQVLSNSSEYKHMMWEEDVTIEARFKYTVYDLKVWSNNSDYGQVIINNGNSQTFFNEETLQKFFTEKVTIVSYSKTNTRFLGWYDEDNNLVSTNPSYTFNMINRNCVLEAKWNYFNIEYDLDGGINNKYNPTYYNVDMNNIKLQEPTKDGYTFNGWEYNGNVITEIKTKNVCHMKLKALWKIINYQITYDLNGGTNDSSNPTKYTCLDNDIILKNPKKEGYDFIGWYDENNNLISSISTNTYKDIRVIAKYDPLTLKANFTSEYGAFDNVKNPNVILHLVYWSNSTYNKDIEVANSETINICSINIPQRSGYTFDWWYLDSSLKNPITDNYTFTGDTTIYGKWINNTSTSTSTPMIPDKMSISVDKTKSSWSLETYSQTRIIYVPLSYSSCNIRGTYSVSRKDEHTGAGPFSAYFNTPDPVASIKDLTTNKTLYNISYSDNASFNISLEPGHRYEFYVFASSNHQKSTDGKYDRYYYSSASISITSCTYTKKSTLNIPCFKTISIDEKYDNKISMPKVLYDSRMEGYVYTWVDENDNLINLDNWNYLTDKNFKTSFSKVISKNTEEAGKLSGTNLYKFSGSTTFTATTNPGYAWIGWYDGNILLSNDLSYTFENFDSKHNYKAKWAKIKLTNSNTKAGSVLSITNAYKYDDLISITATTNVGYSFDGWYYNNQKVCSEETYTFKMPDYNVTYVAKWNPNTNTPYTVEHYKQNLEDSKYVLIETEKLFGTTDNYETLVTKEIPGFAVTSSSPTAYVKADGTGVGKIYYNRITYKVQLDTNISEYSHFSSSNYYKYESNISIKAPTVTGFKFEGWYDLNDELVTEEESFDYFVDVEGANKFTAKYTKEKHKVSINNTSDKIEISGIESGSEYDFDSRIEISTNIVEGFEIKWSINDVVVQYGYFYAFNVPNNDLTIKIELIPCQNFYRNGSSIFFGTYPQTLISNNETINELNIKAGLLPTSSDNYNWNLYEYYIESNQVDYMYYQDIDYDNNGTFDYRGIYFTQYRPKYTTVTSSKDNSYQYNNKYNIENIYWFKYESIKWNILKEETGKLLIISNLLLDSQEYYPSQSSEQIERNGGIGYVNNYELSSIRKFLNETFYNTAFNSLQKELIESGIVDNSASTTADNSNNYVCNNTNDKIFLLSYSDANTYYSTTNERQVKGTDYAKSQGLCVYSSNECSDWWLRSPNHKTQASACYVLYDGTLKNNYYVRNSFCGIRPVLILNVDVGDIKLEKNISDAGNISGNGKYNYSSQVNINAEANPGYTFVGWYKENELYTKEKEFIYTVESSNITFEARYEINKYSIIIDNQIEGLSVTGIISGDEFEYNSEKTLVAENVPSGYTIEWVRSDGLSETGNVYTFNVPASNVSILLNIICLYTRNENTIFLGSYPQTRVIATSENGLSSIKYDSTWISYKYYISSKQTDFMYYKDIDIDNDGIFDYRGVYFTKYRPTYYSNEASESNSRQDDNNYKINTIYWFSYDPIQWDILTEENGKALIIANLILDTYEYYPSNSTSQFEHNGNAGYANDYELSAIRKFLNDTFYNVAFIDLQKELIEIINVDNSSNSCEINTNTYTCNNTNDKLFLLSYKEVTTHYTDDLSMRQVKSSDYAKSQGLYVSSESKTLNNSWWWLRSTNSGNASSSGVITWDGEVKYYSVGSTDGGVRPVCWINL